MKTTNCIFCKIINKELPSYKIYEDKYVYAFLDAFPTSDGHTLIVPKKHYANLMECDDIYLEKVINATQLVSKKLKKALNPLGFNYVSNLGPAAHQMVMHFHFHVLPKNHKMSGLLLGRDITKNSPLEDVYRKIQTCEKD